MFWICVCFSNNGIESLPSTSDLLIDLAIWIILWLAFEDFPKQSLQSCEWKMQNWVVMLEVGQDAGMQIEDSFKIYYENAINLLLTIK